jgi:heme/copper-type cytochrome/quinol oxidase subunit 3
MSLAVARRPVPDALLGTLLLIVAEAMVFTSLVAAYVVLRSGATTWPPIGQPRLPVVATAVNTLALLASAWTIGRRQAVPALGGTAVLGAAFLVTQGREWLALLAFGLDLTAGPYAGLFTAIIWAHGAHALAGLVAVGWAWWRAWRGELAGDALSAVRAWWWFVVAVWPVLYAVVYLW